MGESEASLLIHHEIMRYCKFVYCRLVENKNGRPRIKVTVVLPAIILLSAFSACINHYYLNNLAWCARGTFYVYLVIPEALKRDCIISIDKRTSWCSQMIHVSHELRAWMLYRHMYPFCTWTTVNEWHSYGISPQGSWIIVLLSSWSL